MLRNTVTYAALGLALSAGAAMAETHEVTIFDNDLMPPVVYAQPGDRVRFINDDLGTHVVWSTDDSWTTGYIDSGIGVEFTVTETMSLEYKLDEAYFLDYSADNWQDEIEGVQETGLDISDTNNNGELDEGEIYFESAQADSTEEETIVIVDGEGG